MSEIQALLKSIEHRQEMLDKTTMYLVEMESQLALIFAASPNMILLIYKDGRITNVSQAVQKVLGYTKEELVGRFVWDLIHPEDIEKTKDIQSIILGNKKAHFIENAHFVNRWLKKDGCYAKLSWKFTLYDHIEDNTIGFATDITDAVLENPANFGLLHRVVELTKDGILITDKDCNLIYVNKSFCKTCGYEKEELIGRNAKFLQFTDIEQVAINTIRNSIKNGDSCEVLLKNYKKDGTVFYNNIIISPVVENSIVTNHIGISRDLTSLVDMGVYVWDGKAPRGFGKLK